MCRPELAVRRKPVVELFERVRPDAIQTSLRVRAHLDEPRIFEDAEMLGDGRLADAEAVDELADRPFAVAEQFEDRQTARLGKDLECSESGDAMSIPIQLYACQAIDMRPLPSLVGPAMRPEIIAAVAR